MLTLKTPLTALLLLLGIWLHAQEGGRGIYLGVFGGLSSYQGDLQPNSFSFSQWDKWGGVWVRKPITGHVSIKGGVGIGQLHAADANNRDYLRMRNLSFYSVVKEAYLELELALVNPDKYRLSPFVQGGVTVFHFNPYTYDADGQKVYLHALHTEGQGMADYPDRKPYLLYQPALTFGAGMRYAVSPHIFVGAQTNLRKTFTDYLDDVSSSYADPQALLAYSGPRAVELAYRGDELPAGSAYPKEGEQRGTPTEMDWYYFAGLSVEIKLEAVGKLIPNLRSGPHDWYNKKCPRVNF